MPSVEFIRKRSNSSKKTWRWTVLISLLELEIFLSSPHLLLDDTFRALLATAYSVSQHTADVHMGLTPICYACKLGIVTATSCTAGYHGVINREMPAFHFNTVFESFSSALLSFRYVPNCRI
jgi:hypothetical protein